MTVREWLATRNPAAPQALQQRLEELLDGGGDAPASEAPILFLAAARRVIEQLIREKRFAREGALDLLAADAFLTYAYEHAGERGASENELHAMTRRGAALLNELATGHV